MSSAQDQFIVKRLRLSGTLIILGLLIEGISLAWNHPLSFIAFIGVGGLAVFLGVVIFLLSLVSSRPQPGD
jgi:small-conductance mechanosensitive channel